MHRKLWGTGLNARKTTLGAEHLEKSLSTVNDFNRERSNHSLDANPRFCDRRLIPLDPARGKIPNP